MFPIFHLEEHFGKCGRKMSFGTEISEPNILTLPWERRAMIGSSFLQINKLQVCIIDGFNNEKNVCYRKGYGQM